MTDAQAPLHPHADGSRTCGQLVKFWRGRQTRRLLGHPGALTRRPRARGPRRVVRSEHNEDTINQ